jgi:hypothetical protein
VRILDERSFFKHRDYIVQNPVKAGLVESAEQYPYSYILSRQEKSAGAKAQILVEPERPD